MSEHDDSTNTPQNPPDLAAGLNAFANGFDQVADLLSALVIPDRLVILDLLGNEYEFRPVLSARRTITAGLKMDELVRGQTDETVLAEAKTIAAQSGKLAAITYFFHRVIGDEGTQARFQELFETIHPDIVADAKAAAAAEHKEKRRKGEPPTHVLDLFEFDGLLEALVPFFARFATRISKVLRTVAGSPTSSPGSPSQP